MKQMLYQLLLQEQNQAQHHVPGYNYMGPGTRIATNILSNIPPTNQVDDVAIHHDLDYLQEGSSLTGQLKADWRAIKESSFTPGGVMMKTGLLMRSLGAILTLNKVNFGGKPEPEVANYLRRLHYANYHK